QVVAWPRFLDSRGERQGLDTPFVTSLGRGMSREYQCQSFVLEAAVLKPVSSHTWLLMGLPVHWCETLQQLASPRRAWLLTPGTRTSEAVRGLPLERVKAGERSHPLVQAVPARPGAGVPTWLAVVLPPAQMVRHQAAGQRVNGLLNYVPTLPD